MKKAQKHLANYIGGCAGVITGITLVALISFSAGHHEKNGSLISQVYSHSLLPWESIGGCGTGAAGGSGASYQWLGQGLSGTMLDLEVRAARAHQTSTAWGMGLQNSTTIPVTLNYHPNSVLLNTISLAMPFMWKENPEVMTGGIGDLSVTLQKKLGMTGKIGTSLGLTLPTGKYDIHDISHEYVDPTLQLGGGLFGFSVSADYSIGKDWGLIILGGSYSGGLFKFETVEREWDPKLVRGVPSKKKFSNARVSGETYLFRSFDDQGNQVVQSEKVGTGAENDFGTMTPDNISLFVYAGKKTFNTMTSVGLAASIPMGNSRIREKITYKDGVIQLDEQLDPDAVLRHLKTSVLDSAAMVGADYFISGKDPNDPIGTTWFYGRSTYQQKKSWVLLTPGVGVEFKTGFAPIFMSFTLPIEFNGDNGVGFNGFSFDLGIKWMVF